METRLIRIRMKVRMEGLDGPRRPNEVRDEPVDVVDVLVAGGYAEPVEEPVPAERAVVEPDGEER